MPGEKKDHVSPEAEPLLSSGTNDASTEMSKNILNDAITNERSISMLLSTNETDDHTTASLNDNIQQTLSLAQTSTQNSADSNDHSGTVTNTIPTTALSPKNKSLKSSLNSPNSVDKPAKHLLFEVEEETISMNNENNDEAPVCFISTF